jgi:2-keto-4-pentenoate hydratase/2-oxohepta-3-ene-1,7-dioic acid hydratase in catechol pathway
MRLAIFDGRHGGNRLGVVTADGIADVTDALPWPHDPDPLTAGWWRGLCRDFAEVRPALEKAAEQAPPEPRGDVRLRAPVLSPSKIVAAASNYAAHVAEMHDVQRRTLGRVEPWMMEFDVFLKSPSSVSGPADDIVLPPVEGEIHHEAELVAIIGAGGRPFGYTIGLDMTVRAEGDRSRRKSYATFSPLGPWLTTADEAGAAAGMEIGLERNGVIRQRVSAGDMLVPVGDVVGYASGIMRLLPGDVLFTGAPPGVGPIAAGDTLRAWITGLGEMRLRVR